MSSVFSQVATLLAKLVMEGSVNECHDGLVSTYSYKKGKLIDYLSFGSNMSLVIDSFLMILLLISL